MNIKLGKKEDKLEQLHSHQTIICHVSDFGRSTKNNKLRQIDRYICKLVQL